VSTLKVSCDMPKFLNNKRLIWSSFIILQILCLYMITHHAMWRDELQTWSMARESRTIGELLYNLRYDGTPPLWYICLWVLTSFSTTPLIMQLFHFSCASLASLILMVKAPFQLWMRLVTVSGYYFAFEYMVISRGYVLTLLLGIIYATYRSKERSGDAVTGSILGFMANSTAYGCILSISLFLREIYVSCSQTNSVKKMIFQRLTKLSAAYVPFLVFAIYFMKPAKDGNFVEKLNFSPDIDRFIAIYNKIALCLIPLPENSIYYWNSLFLNRLNPIILFAVSTLMLTSGIVILHKKRAEVITYLTCLTGMLIFGYIVYLGFNRHAGTLYICLIICYWFQTDNIIGEKHGADLGKYTTNYLMIIFLCINTVSFAIAAINHFKYPFSGSREMAEYLKSENLTQRPIIADIDFEVSPVAGYLNIPFYYLSNCKKETYIRWNTDRMGSNKEDVNLFIIDIINKSPIKPLFLFSYPVTDSSLKLIKSTKPSTVMHEHYYLYEKSQ